MTYILLISIINSVVFAYLLTHKQNYRTYQKGLLYVVGAAVLYTLFRFVISQIGVNPTGWDDLIYAVLYLYASIAWIVLAVILNLIHYFKNR